MSNVRTFVIIQGKKKRKHGENKWIVYIDGQILKGSLIFDVIYSIFHSTELVPDEKKYLLLIKDNWHQACQELPMSAWPILVSKMYENGIWIKNDFETFFF